MTQVGSPVYIASAEQESFGGTRVMLARYGRLSLDIQGYTYRVSCTRPRINQDQKRASNDCRPKAESRKHKRR